MSDKIYSKPDKNVNSDTEDNDQQPSRSLALDLGDDCLHNIETNRLGLQASVVLNTAEPSSSTNTKRDENPFSFKHFLRENTSNKNYQALGARPKVYRENRSRHVTSPENPQRPNNRKINEISSALPDFVQDHLVIEQCFLGNKSAGNDFNSDWPDFAQGDHINVPTVSRSNSLDDPIPLDLPGLSLANSFPLDLPANNAPVPDVGNSKSLPDFLTDGPVRNNDAIPLSPLIINNIDRCHNCIELNAELTNVRQRLTRIEEEADRNYRRANTAETTLARLKQETKSLKSQIRQLQEENRILQAAEVGGATGGDDPSFELQAQRLAQELRVAASTAEHSLRSLLTGVDNLRIMASTLENIHRIEEKPSERFSMFEDDSSGPTL